MNEDAMHKTDVTRFAYLHQVYCKSIYELRVVLLCIVFIIILFAKVIYLNELALLEHVQIVLFPFIAIALLFVPRRDECKMPKIFIICALIAGTVTSGIYYSKISLLPIRNHVVFGGFSGDVEALQERRFVRRYEQIAQVYNAPSATMVPFTFEENDHALRWLHNQKDVRLLVYGDMSWGRLALSTWIPDEVNGVGFVENYPEWIIEASQRYKLDLNLQVVGVRSRNFFLPMLLVRVPEEVNVSKEPPELFLHVLGFIARGLMSDMNLDSDVLQIESNDIQGSDLLSMRVGAFRDATHVFGPWRSNSLLGLSEFLLGTFTTYGAILSESEPASFACAIKAFRRAAGYIQTSHDSHLAASIFNNVAVAQLMLSSDKQSIDKALEWLQIASKMRDRNGNVILGARVALFNIMLIERSL